MYLICTAFVVCKSYFGLRAFDKPYVVSLLLFCARVISVCAPSINLCYVLSLLLFCARVISVCAPSINLCYVVSSLHRKSFGSGEVFSIYSDLGSGPPSVCLVCSHC